MRDVNSVSGEKLHDLEIICPSMGGAYGLEREYIYRSS